MPVRSLRSSVIVWPDQATVDRAAREWAVRQTLAHPELVRLGYHGSYARGDWGVGSDLDLVAVMSHTNRPFNERGLEWDLSALPVPAEILIYTENEWRRLQVEGRRSARTLAKEMVWLV